MTYKFSPSSLSLLKDCPRCFWIAFNKGIKRPTGIFPSLPSGMDDVLKNYFDKFMEKGELPPELSELKGNVKLFDNVELLKVWRNNFKGIQWVDKGGNILRGAVDSILKKGDKLIILDFKTRGYPLKEDTHEYYRNQMDLYNFLLRKNGYKTEEYAYLLFYHPNKVNKNGSITFNTDLIKMGIDLKNAESIFKNALKTLSNKCPLEKCEWCENIKI